MTIVIIFGIIFLVFLLYLMHKHDIKHNVYITVNVDNIQKKKYKIKRKDIIQTGFETKYNTNDVYFIVTKKYIYKLTYIGKIEFFTTGYSFFEFESDMEKIFNKKFLNGFRMGSDAPVKFEIVESKDSKEKVSAMGHWS